MATNVAAINYLMLANELVHSLVPQVMAVRSMCPGLPTLLGWSGGMPEVPIHHASEGFCSRSACALTCCYWRANQCVTCLQCVWVGGWVGAHTCTCT